MLKTGEGHGPETDPLPILDQELSKCRVADIPTLKLPPMTGGAVGYVGYDCVKYFEPKTRRPMKDILKVPESLFMLYDTIVVLDHFFQKVMVVTYVKVPENLDNLDAAYDEAKQTVNRMLQVLKKADAVLPTQEPVKLGNEYTSNIGQEGYEKHVHKLKEHISSGDIIQAVPSQRMARPTSLHPFNIYRHLRTVNPSPYLFFLDCEDFHIVGASPELLVKAENGRIYTHPIAGTVKRGPTAEQDEQLAQTLRDSLKDRAEHVMLVDLARNDVNRVCHPSTVKVDRLMRIDRFSHVQHITSEVSGLLRPECTRWDALRSIFPAGTVSGAPKIRAMELIYDLEKEKRGIYAGAAGWFAYDVIRVEGGEGDAPVTTFLSEGQMDTCIAIRTMLVKNKVAYLQAGGGIVFDSEKTEEWMETMNKLAANLRCIELAEKYYGESTGSKSVQEIIEEERKKGDEQYKLQTMSAGA